MTVSRSAEAVKDVPSRSVSLVMAKEDRSLVPWKDMPDKMPVTPALAALSFREPDATETVRVDTIDTASSVTTVTPLPKVVVCKPAAASVLEKCRCVTAEGLEERGGGKHYTDADAANKDWSKGKREKGKKKVRRRNREKVSG